jgi:hypothetical protein
MTSSPHALYALGGSRATMVGTEGSETARRSKSQKAGPSTDWGLKPAPMKSESLVIAHQPRRGECVPEPCTHRLSSHESAEHPKSATQPAREGVAEGETRDQD